MLKLWNILIPVGQTAHIRHAMRHAHVASSNESGQLLGFCMPPSEAGNIFLVSGRPCLASLRP